MRHMTILQVIGARERDLGGFVMRRVLPFEGRQMVGPFELATKFRERIEAAKTRWANREFDAVPGETEFIPLPRP
jgi:hypothetical protein